MGACPVCNSQIHIVDWFLNLNGDKYTREICYECGYITRNPRQSKRQIAKSENGEP